MEDLFGGSGERLGTRKESISLLVTPKKARIRAHSHLQLACPNSTSYNSLPFDGFDAPPIIHIAAILIAANISYSLNAALLKHTDYAMVHRGGCEDLWKICLVVVESV